MGAPVDDEMDIASSTWDTFEAMRCWAPCWIGSRSLAQETPKGGMCLPPFSFFLVAKMKLFFSHTCTYVYIYIYLYLYIIYIDYRCLYMYLYIYICHTTCNLFAHYAYILRECILSDISDQLYQDLLLFLFETYTAISIFWGMWISGKRNWTCTEIQTTLQRWSYFVQHESTSDQ